jgi:hypothetical protein
MNNDFIIENNKLIVKFMQVDNYEYDLWGVNQLTEGLYHKSWDWLMPVVKKIWKIINTYDYDSEKYFHMTEEIFHPDYSLNEFMNADIKSVYNRVIEFIKWYKNNEQYI